MAKHLSGRTAELAVVTREIETIDGYLADAAPFALELEQKQVLLSSIADDATNAGPTWLSITASSPQIQIGTAEAESQTLLTRTIDRLNGHLGGKTLFAGTATDRSPLIKAESLLLELDTLTTGLTDAHQIKDAIRQWFFDPLGGFSNTAYLGETGPDAVRKISATDTLAVPGRADDAAMRETLASMATAAMSGRLADRLTVDTRAELLSDAGENLLTAANGVTGTAADLGAIQARLDRSIASQQGQRATFLMARNDMVRADPFETASALQEIQQQLELHFTATARISRLSLANYL